VSKKKFSSGLDSIFEVKEEVHQAVATTATPVFAPTFDSPSTAQPMVVRRAASKNFTSDLDSLFQDAFTEAVEEKLDKLKKHSGLNDPFESNKRETRHALSGLDALIRSTVDSSLAALEHAAVKRLTIIFENKKIEKLKSIAKMEKAFVKDIVSEVLTEFINDYEKRTGKAV
jgi:hypothetical protein